MKHALTALLVLLPSLALATPPPSARARPGEQCLAAIGAAERRMGLPAQLLRSIALVESGRLDPVTKRILPWPWTINVAGVGYFYASSAEAIAATRAFQARGINSIDVGCAQVNLLHHPGAFSSVENAFDPRSNADYAARFLKSLHARTRNWPLATAAYHSKTPSIGLTYARKVMAIWPNAERYGGLPSAAVASAAPAADYSMYTSEFAARLRRMDEDGARIQGAANIIEFAWSNRLPRLPLPSQSVTAGRMDDR